MGLDCLKTAWPGRYWRRLTVSLCLTLLLIPSVQGSESARVAAASGLRPAMEAIREQFLVEHPGLELEIIYGSSGRFRSQIENGAPFDLFFSADMAYPEALREAGLVHGEVRPYALGRLVLWSASLDAATMTLADLDDPGLRRIAIANPRHAPYGAQAREALISAGVWSPVQPKLVFGENVAQALQLAHSGAADLALVALSLVLSPAMEGQGRYHRVDASLHPPLVQGFVITRRGADNAAARQFADFFQQPDSQRILRQFGFEPATGSQDF